MEAFEKRIMDVFNNDFVFSIPQYQRPYSWGIDNVIELFDDIYEASDVMHQQSSYFLGSIVLIRPNNSRECEIIDGQQRLTSLALLFTALRNSFASIGENDGRGAMQDRILEVGNPITGAENQFRLTIRPRDNNFLTNNVLQPDTFEQLENIDPTRLEAPQRKLRENALALQEKVDFIPDPERIQLATYLVQHTYLVMVITPDLDSAFRIFSVLNDRGLPLTAADILKADLIGAIQNQDIQAEYNEKWEEAEATLDTNRFADLFSHIRMIHRRRKLSGTVLAELRQVLQDNPILSPQNFIDNELCPYANAFSEILTSSFESVNNAEEINRYFGYLRRLRDTDWQAPLILYVSNHRNNPAEILNFLENLERLAMMMWLCRYTSNQRIERYGRIIGDIINNEVLPEALQLENQEKENFVSVLNGEIYILSPPQKRKAILLRLDESLAGAGADYNVPVITIEHILPQTPPDNSEWLQWWENEQNRESNLHRLGNLTLINRRQNSAAKNYDFNRKKIAYFFGAQDASPFVMTNELRGINDWTPAEFERRQGRYVGILRAIWLI